MSSKELWLVHKNHATVKLDSKGVSWNENLQRRQNWTAKSINLKENTGKMKSVFVIRTALWAEKVGCCLEYCRSWKDTLGKLAVDVNTGGQLIRVLNVRSVTDGGNLCRDLWLVILKSVWLSIGDTLQYSWLWDVVSYALLGLDHSRRKARLCVYLTDFKKWWFYVLFLTSICANNYFETEKSWIFK